MNRIFTFTAAAILLLPAQAKPQPAWMKALSTRGCCPGCGSANDPLGPRYRGEPIASPSGTNGSVAASVSTVAAISNVPTTISSIATAKPVPPVAAQSQATNGVPEFIVSGGQKYRSVSFAQLASFVFKSVPVVDGVGADRFDSDAPVTQQVPDAIKSLGEKSVALTGFMLPMHTKDGATSDFLLLRNQSACCYGVMPKINEWVVVRTLGKGVRIIMDTPVTVVGTFHLDEHRENGVLTAIYQLDCDKLITQQD